MAEVANNRPMSEIVTWWIGACVAVAAFAQVWAMIETRGVIERGRSVDNQIIQISHSTAALADRATTRLEEFERLKSGEIPDMGFREPETDVIRPEEMGESITPTDGE